MTNRELNDVKINVEFQESANRQQLSSGDEIKTLFGKIKKWFSDLKTVAFTGSYNDLTNKPSIPTVNNAKLTIQKNGTNVQTFTANQSTDMTANIIVPTKVSELENDSGFKTTDTIYTHPATSGNKHIPSGGSTGKFLKWSSDGTAVWADPVNTTYGVVNKTAAGLAPQLPNETGTTKYLRQDGTWAIPPDNNTTYSNFIKSGTGAQAGLVPSPGTTAGTSKYLREDATWQKPTDDTKLPLTGGTVDGNIIINNVINRDSSGNIQGISSPYSLRVQGVPGQPYGGNKIGGATAEITDLYIYEIMALYGVKSDIVPLWGYDNTYSLGSSSYKWKTVYAGTGTIQTSDRNLKTNINDLDESWVEFFLKLQPKSFMFIDGTSGRTHIGFISQDVEDALAECGKNALEFAGFCRDIKHETVDKYEDVEESVTDPETGESTIKVVNKWVGVENVDILDEDGNPIYIYSLRYEEFVALNTMMIQKLYKQNLDLEQRLNRIEQLLDK